MSRSMLNSPLSLIALAVAGALAAGTAVAHSGGKANAGYAGDGKGHLVTDNFGKCVRTGSWTPDLALPECEGGVAKPAAKPAPVPVAAAPAPTPPPAPVVVPEKITFGAGALFDVGSSTLKPAGKAELDTLAAKLAGASVEGITVTGHTDNTGAAASNQALSERRAESVKSYLVSKGLEADKIRTSGMGAGKPVADNKTADGRARNRRVEIDIRAVR